MTAPDSLGDLARRALDDLLVPLGFQSGQGGDAGAGVRAQVIFCASPEVLDEHFPALQEVREQVPDDGCVDLVLEGSPAQGIVRVDLEGFALSDLLRKLGSEAIAESVAGLPLDDVAEDLDRIRAAMVELVERSQ